MSRSRHKPSSLKLKPTGFKPILKTHQLELTSQDVREISKVILVMLAAGVVITSAFLTPGATGIVAKTLDRLMRPLWRRRRTINRLTRLNYITIKEQPDGTEILTLTRRGLAIAGQATIDMLEIRRPFRWDNKWRIVVFDIPEEKRLARDILRRKLRQLGFRLIQKSVWVLPWPCRAELEFIRELYQLEPYMTFWEVGDSPDFLEMRNHFKV